MSANSHRIREAVELAAFGHYLRTGRRVDIDALTQTIERKFNPNHDPNDGHFTFGPGGGSLSPRRAGNSNAGSGTGQRTSGQGTRRRISSGSSHTSRSLLGSNPAPLPSPRPSEQDDPIGAIIWDYDNGPNQASRSAKSPRPATVRSIPTDTNETVTKLGSILTRGEGNYESYNTGTKDVKNQRVGHSFPHPPAGSVTGKTINQILATERLSGYDRNRMFATGKYQTIIPTLRAAKSALGLTGNERYTPELQERVFRDYLLKQAGGGVLSDFVLHGRGSVDQAQAAAAKMWASIATPAGYPISRYRVVNGRKVYYISNGRMSYYEHPGQNAASAAATRDLHNFLTEINNSRTKRGP